MIRLPLSASQGLRIVIWTGFLLMLGANLPGHMTYDSVAQLHEGHFGARETWGPAFYAWLLGAFDRIVPGTGLFVAASSLIFFASLAALSGLRPRTRWSGVIVALAVVLTPQVLIYQAIVWKDVLFAVLAVAGLIVLSLAARDWERSRRWLWVALAVVALAVAAQARQNGLIAAAAAAVALGWVAMRHQGWLRGVLWGVGSLAAMLALSHLLGVLALGALKPRPGDAGAGLSFGLRLIESYDIVGAKALDPTYRLSKLEAAQPTEARVVAERAAQVYSGERVDLIARDTIISQALARVPQTAIDSQWLDLVRNRPDLYLAVRWEDFRWVATTPNIDRCLPVDVGVDAPASLLADLKMAPRWSGTDQQLSNYVSWWVDTPAYEHVTYLTVSLVLGLFLLWRRQTVDLPMAALQAASLGFAACFFLISIACDYRYLYFCDLTALVGLVYVAIDPSLRRVDREDPA